MPTIFRHSIRRLRKRPGFTLIAVLSLTIGIGANTAIFSVLDAVIFERQPYHQVDRLFDVYLDQDGFAASPHSYPDYEDLREAARGLAELGGAAMTFVPRDGAEGVELTTGELVSANYFELLGLPMALGRGFEPGDDIEGSGNSVVLSHDHWQREHAGDPNVLGSSMRLNGREYRIVGVAPAGFKGSLKGFLPELFVPVSMDGALSPGEGRLASRTSHWFFVKARLEDDTRIEELDTALSALAGDLEGRFPDAWDSKNGFNLIPTRKVLLNPMIDGFLWAGAGAMMAMVGLVLVIACANLAGFLVARATDRRKETAIQLAMGATRRTLIGHQMLDAALLAGLGGLGGGAFAWVTSRLLAAATMPGGLPLRIPTRFDANVLLFCLGVSLLSALLFGLLPAIRSTRLNPNAVLKDENAGGVAKQRLRGALVIAQIAVCTVLLVGSGLFLRSLVGMQSVDPGFGNEPTALLTYGLPTERWSTPEERRQFREELFRELESQPGVTGIAAIDNLHLNLTNSQGMSLVIDGVQPPPDARYHDADMATVGNRFFEVAGIPVVDGKTFEAQHHAQAPSVAVVSQAFAERFFPGESAVGRNMRRPPVDGAIPDSDGDDRLALERQNIEIIGVVADTAVGVIGEQPKPFVYLSAQQRDRLFYTVLARTEADPVQLAGVMMATARRIEPNIMISESKTMSDHLALQLLPARAFALSFGIFAALALLLALVGLYGIVAMTVAGRTREMGIRISLGAPRGHVVGALMQGGVVLAATGAGLGALGAVLLARTLDRLLYGSAGGDPIVLLGVPALMIGCAALASLLPALRALRIDPASSLRAS